jgi:uncharacterized glyoxalase superfamily protein PhnB
MGNLFARGWDILREDFAMPAAFAKNTRATIVPAMRYRDANAAVEWLCKNFGFEEHGVYRNDQGQVIHAELSFGNGMIMLGPVADTPFSRFMRQPNDVGGETQSCYVIVSDADAHYAKAKAGGAEILLDIKDEDYGGRGYSCRDLEGHIWTFGTYDPWPAS